MSKEGDRFHFNPTPSSSAGGKDERHHGGTSERKRRQESAMLARSSRRRSRQSVTPEPSGSGGHEKSGGVARVHHRHGRDRSYMVESTSEHGRGESWGSRSRSLDWEAVRNFTKRANSKLHRLRATLQDRIAPGVMLHDVGISPTLAGSDYFRRVKQAVVQDNENSDPSGRGQQDREGGLSETDEGELIEGEGGVYQATQRHEELMEAGKSLNLDIVAGGCLQCCRESLTASDDYALRRLFRKDNKVS